MTEERLQELKQYEQALKKADWARESYYRQLGEGAIYPNRGTEQELDDAAEAAEKAFTPEMRDELEHHRTKEDAARYRWLRQHWIDFRVARTPEKSPSITIAGDVDALDVLVDATMRHGEETLLEVERAQDDGK